MTPLKDTLELGNQSHESTASQGKALPKEQSGGLRSDAVSLEVPVKVHGSRVTDVVLGTTPHTEPFEEQSSTMIVFPQGAVLKVAATLGVGQMVVITNMKSGQDAICRVLKVRPYGKTHSYVEIEFTQRQPGYWGVYFQADGPELAKRVAPSAANSAAQVASLPTAAPASTAAPNAAAPRVPAEPAPTPAEKEQPILTAPPAQPAGEATTARTARPNTQPDRRVQPNLPESVFASIGSKEEVEPAASATNSAKPLPFVEYEKRDREAEAERKRATINFPTAPPAADLPPVSMAELRGDAQIAPLNTSAPSEVGESEELTPSIAPEPSPTQPPISADRFAAPAGIVASRPARQEMFGVRLDSSVGGAAERAAETGRNWVLIAACIGTLLAAIGGGGYYFYGRPVAHRATDSIPATPAPAPDVNASQNSISQPAISSSSSVSSPVARLTPATPTAAMASESTDTLRESVAATAKPGKTSRKMQSQPDEPAPQKTTGEMPNLSGAMNAHPVASRPASAGQPEAPPSLDASGVSGNAIGAVPGMGASSLNLAVPTRPVPKAPLRVGGNIKPPQMISSVLPAYPSIARQAGVEGNVVIDTVVDDTGSVASMKVVSGPPLLRQAALDALRKWKYEPSTLNGQPVSVQMIVTIQFHR